MSEHHDDGALARQVRGVEALLERKGLVDTAELERALEAYLARSGPAAPRGWSRVPGSTTASGSGC
jgi:nitrile hydratase